eukprot:10362848-Prorocentrum_lima.AAC.1
MEEGGRPGGFRIPLGGRSSWVNKLDEKHNAKRFFHGMPFEFLAPSLVIGILLPSLEERGD